MADTSNAKHCANCACLLFQPVEETVGTRTARVEELLRRNHPLLDVELSAFRKIAEDMRSTLEDLDSKIAQARELLENLLSARQRAQSRLEDTKTLLHPIRSIPNELLVEIFGRCIPEILTDKDPDSLDPEGAPWLLGRVCHRWRELAVNTPQLWTHLVLDFDTHSGHITERQCAYKTGLFIQRSRGLLMDVYLGSTESIADHPVLPVLEVSIPLWRSLEVDLPETSLQTLSGNSFLNLQRLQLKSDESDLNIDVFQPMRAPVLQDFEVSIGQPWRNFKHFPFPWSHLTSVTGFPAFDVDALNFLHTMTELKELEVLAWSETHAPIRNVVSLSKLRRLTITESDEATGYSKEFFSALAIPALSELTLVYYGESVLRFPTSPFPLGNLIKLDITCEMDSHEENAQHLLDFLTLTHHVEWLCLYDLNMTLEFVDGLNLDDLPDGSPVRLPCLCFLDIGKCRFLAPSHDDDLDPLFEMLYSRLPIEGRKGEEETVNSCNAGSDGTGQNGPSNEETGMECNPRFRFDSDDHPRCLKTVRLWRQLYVRMRTRWPETFLEMTSRAELECAVATRDIDD